MKTKIEVKDEWFENKHLIAEAFSYAVTGRTKGNPAETIDYSNLKVGTEIEGLDDEQEK